MPREWLTKLKRTWFCKYPPKTEYNNVQQWSKERKSPESTWKEYSVKFLQAASKKNSYNKYCLYNIIFIILYNTDIIYYTIQFPNKYFNIFHYK